MALIPQFAQAQVLVIGDLMLDQYWYGETNRISPEAPVPVVKVNGDEHRAGGAANVALNVAKLGSHCSCLGITGEDDAAQKLTHLLESQQVQTLFTTSSNPTITKLRLVSQQQQLIRVDFEETQQPVAALEALSTAFKETLPKSNVVILSDYGKGSLVQTRAFIDQCNEQNIPVFVDPKGTDFSRYRGATLLTPNFSEFQAVVGEVKSEEALVARAEELMQSLKLAALLVTRGADGMTLIQGNGFPPLHIAAHAKEVFDVTGAGDTVIATLAAAVAAGETLTQAVVIANLAASLVVSKLGTAFIDQQELQRALSQQEHKFGVVNQHELQTLVKSAQRQGETVVLTNGCFDMLHSGHITYLQEAKAKGHRLIVAVNSDESVRALKGPTRPINGLDHRMALLAALRAVDWVVPFSEETPQHLIQQLLPDILVKGGDYQVSEIAGHEEVLAAGGRVEILSFIDGQSTTGTIQRIVDTMTTD